MPFEREVRLVDGLEANRVGLSPLNAATGMIFQVSTEPEIQGLSVFPTLVEALVFLMAGKGDKLLVQEKYLDDRAPLGHPELVTIAIRFREGQLSVESLRMPGVSVRDGGKITPRLEPHIKKRPVTWRVLGQNGVIPLDERLPISRVRCSFPAFGKV
jgi:hypothetical protein